VKTAPYQRSLRSVTIKERGYEEMSFCKLARLWSILVFTLVLTVGGTGFTAALADSPGASTASQQQNLGLNDAINLAWAYSPDIKAAQDSISALSSMQQNASQSFQGFQPGPGVNESPVTDMMWKDLAGASSS
jgi:hypothetical protein